MIQVLWELDEGGIDRAGAETATQGVLSYYQQALAGVSCPDHGSGPSLVVRGRTIGGLRVSVETCCLALKAQADERIRRVSRRDGE